MESIKHHYQHLRKNSPEEQVRNSKHQDQKVEYVESWISLALASVIWFSLANGMLLETTHQLQNTPSEAAVGSHCFFFQATEWPLQQSFLDNRVTVINTQIHEQKSFIFVCPWDICDCFPCNIIRLIAERYLYLHICFQMLVSNYNSLKALRCLGRCIILIWTKISELTKINVSNPVRG